MFRWWVIHPHRDQGAIKNIQIDAFYSVNCNAFAIVGPKTSLIQSSDQ